MERNNPIIGNTRRRIDQDCVECGERFSQTVRKLDYAEGWALRERCRECWLKTLAGQLEDASEGEGEDA